MNKLKLTTLSEKILKEKETKALLGGICCQCSCYWENNTGSSSNDNRNANNKSGFKSEHGCNQYLLCTDGHGGMIVGEAGGTYVHA